MLKKIEHQFLQSKLAGGAVSLCKQPAIYQHWHVHSFPAGIFGRPFWIYAGWICTQHCILLHNTGEYVQPQRPDANHASGFYHPGQHQQLVGVMAPSLLFKFSSVGGQSQSRPLSSMLLLVLRHRFLSKSPEPVGVGFTLQESIFNDQTCISGFVRLCNTSKHLPQGLVSKPEPSRASCLQGF